MDLKLKYQISGISNVSPDATIDRIKLKLAIKKYRIVNITDWTVEFDIDPWGTEPRHSPLKVSGGKFEVSVVNGQVTVELNYYNKIVTLLVFLTLFMGFVSTSGVPEMIIAFGLFFVIYATLHIIARKSKGRELLGDILNIDTIQ